jgi:hypothetical protein
MLIIALVLAVIGLAALVTAVVTSNELIAWVCIAASVIGVVLLIIDALRERSRGAAGDEPAGPSEEEAAEFDAEYPDEAPADESEDAEAETTAAPVEPADDEVAGEDRNTR